MRAPRVTRVVGLVAMAVGCSAPAGVAEDQTSLADDVGVQRAGLRKGTPGAKVGDGNYCDNPAAPCAAGEGDCDGSASCEAGLVCSSGKLKQFGFTAGDACVPAHCANKRRDVDETQIDCGGSCGAVCATPVCRPNGTNGRCNSDCLCGVGEGDCDSSTECAAGLVCAGKLSQFGFATGNACVPAHCANHLRDGDETQIDCGGSCGTTCITPVCKANGDSDRCTTADCKCGVGEGDCDSNAQCATGLVCGGKLSQFGFAAGGDACVPPHCTNNIWDSNETQVDCGGDCGTVGCDKVCLADGTYVIPLTGQFRYFDPEYQTGCPSGYKSYRTTVTVTVTDGSVYVSGNNYSGWGLSGTYPVTQSSNESYTAEIHAYYGGGHSAEFECGLAEWLGFGWPEAEGSAKLTFNCKTGIASFEADCLADHPQDGCYPNYNDISKGTLSTK